MQRILSVVVILSLGCVGDGLVAVQGQVTLDGQPLTHGVIRLDPVDGKGPTTGLMIVDGAFSGRAFPGPKRVSITAAKIVGQLKAYDAPDSPLIDETVELIPARYNAKSVLSADVAAGGSTLTFDLINQPDR